MVESLRKKSLLPMVVFCFSKARCDASADSLTALDMTTSSEKSEIHRFCDKAFSRLKGSDRRLPQVLRIQELLQRGIGCHHAGLLPIVKEVVELLFCRGLLKLLFSTETFAMGVNAPARTVAFHSVRKHDGKSFRTLLPGEYTQMAGRAGRRGLDKVGTVLLMCWDEIPEEAALRTLLTGQPTRLESQFRLTYNMILNLLRVEDLKVEDMLKRSFAEFHAQRALPATQQQLRVHEASLQANQLNIECILGDPTIASYYEYARQVEDLTAELTDAILGSRAGQALMTSGRLITVKTPDHPPTLGMVLREAPSRPTPSGIPAPLPSYFVVALHRGPLPPSSQTPPSAGPSSTPPTRETEAASGLLVGKRARDSLGGLDYGVTRGRLGARGVEATGVVTVPLPYYGESSGSGYFVAEVRAVDVVAIGRDKVKVESGRILESGLVPEPSAVGVAVERLQLMEAELQGEPLPEVEPRDLKMTNLDTAELYSRRAAVLAALAGNPCATCPVVPRHYQEYRQHALLRERVRHLKHELSDDSLTHMPDFEQRVAVLQQLGYLDQERVVQLKGRVACEVNSGDELVAAEMILDNQLDDLQPAEAVALLSAFVFQDKTASDPQLTHTLAQARDRLAATALELGKIQGDHGLPVVPEDYLKSALNFGLMEVVYEWAQGTPFSEICTLTDVPEGSIVRCIVRLDETCRETKNAARLIGNSSLYQKMEAASAAIKRDIVFAASLYVTGTASF